MNKLLLGSALAFAGIAASGISASAATLDDVMAQLESMQRDNQAIRRDNEAMRKELSALRQNDTRSTRQAVAPANAPVRRLTPAVSSAMAADMPMKAGGYVPPPQAFSWSGFYLGLHAGYGWSSNNWTSIAAFEAPLTVGPLNAKANGVLGGVQAGANYQIASWVFGMEADLAVLRSKGSSTGTVSQGLAPGTVLTATATSKIDWLAMFTGRAGYALDRTLFYVKGGIAAAETRDNFSVTQATSTPPVFIDLGTKNSTQVGWTIGGGIEHAFAPNWSAKIEYNYVDLGKSSENFNFVTTGGSLTFRPDIEHKLQIVKVGANYRFSGI
jgi:outer membrane immunogenic protein